MFYFHHIIVIFFDGFLFECWQLDLLIRHFDVVLRLNI